MKPAPKMAKQPEQRSLFGEILNWMLKPILLLWPVSLVFTWLVAQDIAGKPFDRALEYNVKALAQLITVQNNKPQFVLPQPARQLLRADDADTVYYQVLGPKGEYLSGERALPTPPTPPTPTPTPTTAPTTPPTTTPTIESNRTGDVHLYETEYQGVDMKVAYMWVTLDAPLEKLQALVQVAETMDKRSLLATEIVKGVMLPQFVILPLAVLLVWLALVQAIKPLNRLEERIRARRPDDLSPLDANIVPKEVGPLVAAVNDLLLRLKDSIATQKRFLADAAHQLKTPLAGLRMQADLAQSTAVNAQDLKQSLRQIIRSSVRATHTVNQLLALARAESSGTVLAHQPCDLAKITMEVVRDCIPRAMDRGIDAGYEGVPAGSKSVVLPGNPTLLTELVRNLIDNAINYAPGLEGLRDPHRPVIITARLTVDTQTKIIMLQVEDNGPGIPHTERDQVFQPFYRALGNEVDGSGLGLSIVKEIANQHHAVVTVEDSKPGAKPPGTCVTVRFVPRV